MAALDLYFIDNGEHAYLEVSYGVANAVPVNALNSNYSYYDSRNRVYYIEEDVDAPEVISALRELGYTVNLHDLYEPNFNPKRFTQAKYA